MTGPSHDPHEALKTAHAMAAAGDHVGAFAVVTDMLARDGMRGSIPAAATALAAVARAAERAGDPVAARRALETALGVADWADLHLALGTLLVGQGDAPEARREFDRALAVNPGCRAAIVERALLDAREGRIAEAVEAMRPLTGSEPTAEHDALRLGLERLRAAAVEDAAPLLRRALAGGDEALEVMLGDAQASLTAGDFGAGLNVLRRAVRQRPGYADLHALLGSHELRAGFIDDGLASLVHALELNPDFHSARLELARGLEARGERDASLFEVQRVLDVNPANADALSLRGRLTGRRPGAIPARG